MQPYTPAPIYYFHKRKFILLLYSNFTKIEEPTAVIFYAEDLTYTLYLWPDRII